MAAQLPVVWHYGCESIAARRLPLKDARFFRGLRRKNLANPPEGLPETSDLSPTRRPILAVIGPKILKSPTLTLLAEFATHLVGSRRLGLQRTALARRRESSHRRARSIRRPPKVRRKPISPPIPAPFVLHLTRARARDAALACGGSIAAGRPGGRRRRAHTFLSDGPRL